MYELARVRLHSAGPRGARYQDVTLDLRDAGAVIERPAQEALFALDRASNLAGEGRLRRPSPATVLFLENGGGKSVLLKLIFSVMLPFRRQVVGTSNTRVLEKFVLAQDVAQIALEWQHTTTGQRVVTGKASAWRDQVVSADPNRLSEAWYSFRPTATFHLDALPFTDQGRLVSLAGFRDRFTEAHRREPELEAVWQTGREAWSTHLANLGLDPELFAYQRRMNAGEGEAADAFTFRTDEAFVDWLLTAVTGEDDPRALGDVMTSYASRLAERQALQDERDFVAGALERIGPLAHAAEQAEVATAAHREARNVARRFAAALAARVAQESARHAELVELVVEAAGAERDADQLLRRLGRIQLELRRLVAGLRWRRAEQEQQRLQQEQGRARLAHQAWRETAALVRHTEAANRADAVRAVVAEKETEAAPVLHRRDQAAHRYARGLLGVAKTAEAQSRSYDRQATALDERAGQAQSAGEQAVTEAATQRALAGQRDSSVDGARVAVEAAVADGLLPAATADVAAAADRAAAQAGAARGKYAQALAELSQLATERDAAGRRRREAETAHGSAATATAQAARELSTAEQAAAPLAGDDRLAGLLGTEAVDLETDAPTLLELLRAALDTAGSTQTTLRMAEAADERVLTALGTGGLLPPAEELIEAVRVLERAGIAAWSGWQYLAQTPPGERPAILETYPHLVDGIVLNRAEQLDQAQRALAAARLLPRAIVAVGTTVSITAPAAARPPGLDFLVEPNPALYDPDTAQQERGRLLAAQTARQAELAGVSAQIAVDQRLHQRLSDWYASYPPGRLPQLREQAARSRDALAQAETTRQQAVAEAEQLEQREQEVRESLGDLHAAEATATARAEALRALAARVVEVAGWQDQARAARLAAEAADRDAAAHRAEEHRHRRQAEHDRGTAADHRRTASTCREELGRVPGAGDVDESVPAPTEPVAQLRAAYEAAASAYQQVQVGADLRAELDQADRAAVAARAAVEQLPAEVRELAADLLASPDGTDAASRDAATERAQRTLTEVEATLSAQTEQVGQLRNDHERMQRQEVSLEPYGRPRDVAHGDALVARVGADADQARAGYERAERRYRELQSQAEGAREAERAFLAHLDALAAVSAEGLDPQTAPFPGTDPEARARRAEVVSRLYEAERQRDERQRAVRRDADALAQYATQERFEQVSSPVRRQIASVEREQLPAHAAQWQSALRPRLRTLDDDLAQIERHRASIVERLQGLVGQALRTLHSAQRLSRLAEGLGDWSGQEFLRIRFAEPDPAVLAERLGQVIDDAATAAEAKGAAKRDGLSLLLRGVRAAVAPKGVRVEMLKPDAVLRTERVRVAEIGDVFSGGQLLTAAIILYCTMARLRANERGYARRPHAGVLFLDNPIGRASAGYLLELQLKVAEALNVQLIYTTGLFDVNALSVFPLIIRLRNDADLRAGLKYLSVEPAVAAPLAELPEPDDTATVTATRVFRRPAPHPRSGP